MIDSIRFLSFLYRLLVFLHGIVADVVEIPASPIKLAFGKRFRKETTLGHNFRRCNPKMVRQSRVLKRRVDKTTTAIGVGVPNSVVMDDDDGCHESSHLSTTIPMIPLPLGRCVLGLV